MQVKQYLSFTVWPLMMTSLVLGGGRYPPELVPFAISVEKRKRADALNVALNLCGRSRLGGPGSASPSAAPTPSLRSPVPFWEASGTRHTNGGGTGRPITLALLARAWGCACSSTQVGDHVLSSGQWGASIRGPAHPVAPPQAPPIHSLSHLGAANSSPNPAPESAHFARCPPQKYQVWCIYRVIPATLTAVGVANITG